MRGQHALDAVHIIVLMAEALERNACRGELKLSTDWQPGTPLTPTEVAFVRLGALLHDIGHVAAGHTLEDELGLLPPHDANKRLKAVLDRTDWHGREYESLRDRIDYSRGRLQTLARGSRPPARRRLGPWRNADASSTGCPA